MKKSSSFLLNELHDDDDIPDVFENELTKVMSDYYAVSLSLIIILETKKEKIMKKYI